MNRLLTPNSQKKYIDRSSIVKVAKYPKLYRHSQRIFSSNKAMSTLRTVVATKSNSRFLGGWRPFATLVRTDWITMPRRRPTLESERSFKSSNVSNLPFTRLRRYFSLRLWPSRRSRLTDDMCRKSIFVSFRSGRLRMTTHWPQHIYREDVLRWAWKLHIILVIVWAHYVMGWENGTVEARFWRQQTMGSR